MKALSIAATGMNAQQTNLEVIANNIANINTTGFKRARAEFSDLCIRLSAVKVYQIVPTKRLFPKERISAWVFKPQQLEIYIYRAAYRKHQTNWIWH